jgi:hypothetical protein
LWVDVQLVVFAGVDNTIQYLKSLGTTESQKAVEYLEKCEEAGDLDRIEEYFSQDNMPWWI